MHFSRCTGWEVKIFAGKVVVDSVVENLITSQYQCSEITQNQKSSVVIRKLSLTITQSQNCVRKLSSNDRKCFFFKIRFFHTRTHKKKFIFYLWLQKIYISSFLNLSCTVIRRYPGCLRVPREFFCQSLYFIVQIHFSFPVDDY